MVFLWWINEHHQQKHRRSMKLWSWSPWMKRNTSINFMNFYVENDVDCNAIDSHFEHHHIVQNRCMKWVEKADFNYFELHCIDQSECLDVGCYSGKQPLRTPRQCSRRMLWCGLLLRKQPLRTPNTFYTKDHSNSCEKTSLLHWWVQKHRVSPLKTTTFSKAVNIPESAEDSTKRT